LTALLIFAGTYFVVAIGRLPGFRVDRTGAAIEVTGPIATDDMSFVRKAVLAGAGIGMLPTFLCGRAEHAGKLVRVLDGWSLNGAVLHLAGNDVGVADAHELLAPTLLRSQTLSALH
jgi:DNA-binding transcriptional LysR family regulator